MRPKQEKAAERAWNRNQSEMPSLAKRYRHKRPGKIKIFGADDRNAKWACLESTLLLPTASVAGTAQVLIDRLPESIRKCTTHSPGRHPIPHMADASSQGMLSAFPFLTEPEFDHACAAFLDRVQALESLHVSGWSSVRLEKQVGYPSYLSLYPVLLWLVGMF